MIIAKQELESITNTSCSIPHDFLGAHLVKTKGNTGIVIRAYLQNAKTCQIVDISSKEEKRYDMTMLDKSGFFELFIPKKRTLFNYRLRVETFTNEVFQIFDPYTFLPTISEDDLFLIAQGNDHFIYNKLGSHIKTINGITGTAFAVWAPNAKRVSVVGDFNNWDARYHQMRLLGKSGIWEIFVPNIKSGQKYKYEISDGQTYFLKSDPYAIYFEPSPNNASIVFDLNYQFNDSSWIKNRQNQVAKDEPISIYEVHLGSWKKALNDGTRNLNYIEAAYELADYVKMMGFTHIEFLPLSEFPFDGSWGYQVTGFYAPTCRYGNPNEFAKLVDIFHEKGIGVIMDFVPAHFPKDSFALAKFDGSCLYEHQDPRQGEQLDWGTLVFNYGRNEVAGFLTGAALAWFDRFHIDGLRVDAVASMLYLDYSREEGNWVANEYGGRENIAAIEFLKKTNSIIHTYFKGAITIAEESTSFEGVTKDVKYGGLGFDFKWNMGWMHDTLKYFSKDPIYRKWHHNNITFAMLYQYDENFVSVLSHDEVVHMKGSMINKMGVSYWNDKSANLRLLYSYMWMWPGKKTLFMGNEFGQSNEWKYDGALDWNLLQYTEHSGVANLVRDMNKVYTRDKNLASSDYNKNDFSWINCDDNENSVLSFCRTSFNNNTKKTYVCIFNFTPNEIAYYQLGVPQKGIYKEIINTDSHLYGGKDRGNLGQVQTQNEKLNNFDYSIGVRIAPFAGIVFLNSDEENSF